VIMVKALDLVIDMVRKLPEERQEESATLLESLLADQERIAAVRRSGSWLGYMRGTGKIIGDIEDTSDLWPDDPVENEARILASRSELGPK
jgi:hypothetical protein